jgi:excisionase family DNA binding protein
VTVSFEFPPDFVEQLARRVAELSTDGRGADVVTPYLDVDEAAHYLACPKSRIYDLKALGRLQYAKDGRRLLFRREWLDSAVALA